MTARRTRSGNPLAWIFAKHISHGTVLDADRLNPTLRRIRIGSDSVAERQCLPGQHVRIELRDPLSFSGLLQPGETLRTYTVWNQAPAEGWFELLAHLYDGDGIGRRWAADVQPGDDVKYWGPMGDFTIGGSAPYHLFIGEETGTAAFRPLIESLPTDTPAYAVLESETPDDEAPLPQVTSLRRVHRLGASAAASTALVDAVRDIDLPDQPGFAYVAGEARTGQMVREHLLRERGWPRDSVVVKAFWTPGRRGLHH